MEIYDPEWEAELLAWENRVAHDPYEPFQAVGALFNADLQSVEPNWAPRDHWEVLSKFKIAHRPVEEIISEQTADGEIIQGL